MNDVTSPVSSVKMRAEALKWHHSIDLGGYVTPGNTTQEFLRKHQDIYLRDVAGKSFLDIGCWDGANSFAAAQRGASRVLATDHFAWSDQCWGDFRAFELARSIVAPQVEAQDIDLPHLSVESVGNFDVVLFAGVFYHLRHPFQVLEQIAPIATDQLVIETHIDALNESRPAMVFYPGKELANDETNWWGPNIPCVVAMLKDLGFSKVDVYPDNTYGPRATFVGRRHAVGTNS